MVLPSLVNTALLSCVSVLIISENGVISFKTKSSLKVAEYKSKYGKSFHEYNGLSVFLAEAKTTLSSL